METKQQLEKAPHQPIVVEIYDTERIKAVGVLAHAVVASAEATKALAETLRGNIARVDIRDCHIEGTFDAGIKVDVVEKCVERVTGCMAEG